MQQLGRLPPTLLDVPDFPSLRHNSFFADLWRRSAAASLSAVIGPDSMMRHFQYSQHSADPDRHSNRGSEACVTFVVQIGVEGLLNPSALSDLRGPQCEAEWRRRLVQAVRKKDAEGSSNGVNLVKEMEKHIRGYSTLMMTEPLVLLDQKEVQEWVHRFQSQPALLAFLAPKGAIVARACTVASPAPTGSPWPEATSVSTAPASFEPTIAPTAVATSEHQAYWGRRVVEKAQGD